MANHDLADIEGPPYTRNDSMFSLIEPGLLRSPDKLAVISPHQSPDHLRQLIQSSTSNTTPRKVGPEGCLAWTYSEIHTAACTITAGMMQHGVKIEMTLSTLIPASIEWSLILWVSTILKLKLAPLDPGALTESRKIELDSLFGRIRPQIVVVPDTAAAKSVDEAIEAAKLAPPVLKVILERESQGEWFSLLDLAQQDPVNLVDMYTTLGQARIPDPDRVAAILFTSGTSTGNPKGCPKTVQSITQSTHAEMWAGKADALNSNCLAGTANFRAIALAVHLTLWHHGGTVVLADPGKGLHGWLDAIEKHKITVLPMIPGAFLTLSAYPEFENTNVSSVETVIVGGDIVTKDLFTKIQNSFPSAEVRVAHGMTEGSGWFTWPFVGYKPEDVPAHGEIFPLGQLTAGTRLSIRDPDTFEVVRRGNIGEMCCAKGSLIDDYLDGTHVGTSFREDEDGVRWFLTGDLAMVKSTGIFYILGRSKDIVKRDGVPITPAALESTINTFAHTSTSVVAWPHETHGQVPIAVVSGLNGQSETNVQQEILNRFGKDYELEAVVPLGQLGLESFPLNATGKVMKPELLSRLEMLYNPNAE